MTKANGTDAKDIALHFINSTVGRATPTIMAKTITQAKTLLSSGYTKEEIIESIDYLINVKNVSMYSLGYLNSAINNVLQEIQRQKDLQKAKEVKQQIQETFTSEQKTQRDEVITDGESTQRNRDKLNRIGLQPRFGEKLDFDMFKGK